MYYIEAPPQSGLEHQLFFIHIGWYQVQTPSSKAVILGKLSVTTHNMFVMMTELYTIQGVQKDVYSLEGTTFKKFVN